MWYFMYNGKGDVIQCGKLDIDVFNKTGWTLITDPDRIAELTTEQELAIARPAKKAEKPAKKAAPKKSPKKKAK